MEEGIVLFGEAAKDYITYCYVELFVCLGFITLLFGGIAYALYRSYKSDS